MDGEMSAVERIVLQKTGKDARYFSAKERNKRQPPVNAASQRCRNRL
jgi:hypothetical protein